MAYENLLYEQDGGILTITMNRPNKLNALTDVMLGELNGAFKQAEKERSVRVVVLTGAGRGFCVGADLAVAQERSSDVPFDFGHHLRTTFNPLIMKIRTMPKPVIGAINGVAAGAGMSIALACDITIAAESATFIQSFVKIGLAPDSGSTWLLPRLIGAARAMDLMLTGRKATAREAYEWGMINQVLEDAQVIPAAQSLAREFANAPTTTIGYIKRAVEYANNHSLEAAMEYEADMQDAAGKTADHAEGVQAFLQKRTPNFKGE